MILQGYFGRILGACYPEGHYESKSLDEDIHNLKYKIGAGAKVLITQLFFDNQKFYEFLATARNLGIDVPVSAGIMPIVSHKQIEKTVALSGASIPPAFAEMIEKYGDDPDALYEHGIQYAHLTPEDKPKAKFSLCDGDEVRAVYAFCNQHDLWRK